MDKTKNGRVKEEAHYFKSGGANLLGIWRRTGQTGVPVVLFHHGFTGNKCEAHRIFVKLARRFAAEGIESFRFDFFGSGDSEGEIKNVTLTMWLQNSMDAVDYLRQNGANRIVLLGFSFGAFVAAATAAKIEPEGLILWAPIFHPFERMMREKELLAQAKDMGYANLGGEELGVSLMEDAAGLQIPKIFKTYSGNVLLVHGSEDASALPAESERFKAFYRPSAKKIDLEWIQGANHSFDRPDWEKRVIAITASWVSNRL